MLPVSELQSVDRLKNMEHSRLILTDKRETKYSENTSQSHFACQKSQKNYHGFESLALVEILSLYYNYDNVLVITDRLYYSNFYDHVLC
jgi:hypothetical protein